MIRKFLLVVPVMFLCAVFYNMVRYRYDLIDATIRLLLFEDTRWATGFSDWDFADVKTGMTEEEVFQITGEPLFRGTNKYAAKWTYFLTEPKKHNCKGKKIYFDQAWIINKIDPGFDTLHLGMHKDDVLAKLGKPRCYTKFDDSYEYTWSYSDVGEISQHHDRRWIRFDRSGKVIDITHYYYVD